MIPTLRNRTRRYYKNNEPQTTFFKNNIKNTLKTFEAQNGENFKNIEPRSKITGSYNKKKSLVETS